MLAIFDIEHKQPLDRIVRHFGSKPNEREAISGGMRDI